tara:strand:+ start:1250 stop:1783 length:534 start_codon:yes stop_codon:yes gene_type:complete
MSLSYVYHTVSIIQSIILPFIADDKLKEYVTNVLYGHLLYFIIDSIIQLYNKKTNIYIYHHILSGTIVYNIIYNIDSVDRIIAQIGLDFVTWADISAFVVNIREDYIKDGKINLTNDFIFLLIYTYCRGYKFLKYIQLFQNEYDKCLFLIIIYIMSMYWLSLWYYKYIIRLLKKKYD